MAEDIETLAITEGTKCMRNTHTKQGSESTEPCFLHHMCTPTLHLLAFVLADFRFSKAKAIFPTDDSIGKEVYLSVREITKKWTMPVRDWGMAYSQFVIFFADRMSA